MIQLTHLFKEPRITSSPTPRLLSGLLETLFFCSFISHFLCVPLPLPESSSTETQTAGSQLSLQNLKKHWAVRTSENKETLLNPSACLGNGETTGSKVLCIGEAKGLVHTHERTSMAPGQTFPHHCGHRTCFQTDDHQRILGSTSGRAQ